MGLIDRAAQAFGIGKSVGPVTQKGVDAINTPDAFGQVFGSASSGPAFQSFVNTRSQLNTYYDWVYAAASRVAEECSTIDIELYINRTKTKNATMSRKLATQPLYAKKFKGRKASEIVVKDGRLVVRANVPELEEAENHALMDLLDRPNKFMSGVEFFEMTFLHLELTGNAFWAVLRDKKGKPAELWPLYPQYIRIVPDEKEFIKGYLYSINGEQVPFDTEDIIHHKYSNPVDMRWGMSTVHAAARAIDTDNQAADYNRKFFHNSAQPDAVLYTDKFIDDKTFNRVKSQFNSLYGGTSNAHKTAILENGLKYQIMNPNQREMEFLKSREFNRDMILAMFGVPKSILGMDASMSRANAETAEYVFAKGTLRPKFLRLIAGIQEKLAPQFDERLVVSFVDPVPEDKEYKQKERKELVHLVLTKNEVRLEMGMEPVDGGDLLYVPNTMSPIGVEDDSATLEDGNGNSDVGGDKDELHPEGSDDTSTGASGTDSGADGASGSDVGGDSAGGTEGAKAIHAVGGSKKKEYLHQKAVNPADYLDKRNDVADKYEPKVIKAVHAHVKEQEKEVLSNLNKRIKSLEKGGKMTTKGMFDDLFDIDKSQEGWQSRLSVIFRDIIAAMGLISIEQLEKEIEGLDLPPYDVSDPNVKEYYENRIRRVSVYFDEETQAALAATLQQGIDAGETVDELRERVKTLYAVAQSGDIMWYRAERIGRTEPIFATTWTTLDAWKKSGVVSGKKWHTAPEAVPAKNNPCSFCRAMNNRVVSVDDTYFKEGDEFTVEDEDGIEHTRKLDYVDTIGPPLHPNCRCTLLPILVGEDGDEV